MVVIVKFIVVIALPAMALLVCKGYAEYVNASVERARGFLALLEHIERKIGGYLTPPSKLGEGFSDKSLGGMMERIASGESFIDAYRQCADPLPPSVNKILEELFCDFGKGDSRFEIRRVRDASERLKSAVSLMTEEGERQKKICSAVVPAFALGIVIFLL